MRTPPIHNRRLHSGASPGSRSGRVGAVRAGLVLAAVLAGVFTAGAAHADPSPQPQPAPGPPATTPPQPQPQPQPSPTPPPGPGTPQPMPTPPATMPTPPVGTPNPQPGPPVPQQPAPPPASGTDDDQSWWDIPGQIKKAINDFFIWVATSSLTPILETMGQTILGTPDLTASPPVQSMWTGTLVVANALLVLFITVGAFTAMTQHTLQSQYGIKEILPRIAVGAVAANVSLLVFGKVIPLVNVLCGAIVGEGVDPHAAAQAILNAVSGASVGNTFLLAMMLLAMVVMAIVVMIMFIVRTAIMVLLVGSAPLALLCHASPQTESLAFLWWRSVAACFGIQIAEAVILLATLRVFLTPGGPTVLGVPTTGQGLLAILVCLTMLWLLIKLPGLARRLVLGNAFRKQGRGLIGQIISTVLLVKALSLTGGGAKTAATTSRPGTRPTPTRTASTTGTATRTATARPTRAPGAFAAPGGTGPDPALSGRDRGPYRNTRWRDEPVPRADASDVTSAPVAPPGRTPANRVPPSRFGGSTSRPPTTPPATARRDEQGTARPAPSTRPTPRARRPNPAHPDRCHPNATATDTTTTGSAAAHTSAAHAATGGAPSCDTGVGLAGEPAASTARPPPDPTPTCPSTKER